MLGCLLDSEHLFHFFKSKCLWVISYAHNLNFDGVLFLLGFFFFHPVPEILEVIDVVLLLTLLKLSLGLIVLNSSSLRVHLRSLSGDILLISEAMQGLLPHDVVAYFVYPKATEVLVHGCFEY